MTNYGSKWEKAARLKGWIPGTEREDWIKELPPLDLLKVARDQENYFIRVLPSQPGQQGWVAEYFHCPSLDWERLCRTASIDPSVTKNLSTK